MLKALGKEGGASSSKPSLHQAVERTRASDSLHKEQAAHVHYTYCEDVDEAKNSAERLSWVDQLEFFEVFQPQCAACHHHPASSGGYETASLPFILRVPPPQGT